jgi:hypothetical protein
MVPPTTPKKWHQQLPKQPLSQPLIQLESAWTLDLSSQMQQEFHGHAHYYFKAVTLGNVFFTIQSSICNDISPFKWEWKKHFLPITNSTRHHSVDQTATTSMHFWGNTLKLGCLYPHDFTIPCNTHPLIIHLSINIITMVTYHDFYWL